MITLTYRNDRRYLRFPKSMEMKAGGSLRLADKEMNALIRDNAGRLRLQDEPAVTAPQSAFDAAGTNE